MLGIMRKYSQQILIGILVAFVGSIVIFGIASTLSYSGKSNPTEVKNYSDFATMNGEALDYFKYAQLLKRALSKFNPNDVDPSLVEYLKFSIFQEYLNYSLMLKQADENKIKVSGRELDDQIQNIINAYKLTGKGQLKELLTQNGLEYKGFKRDLENDIKVAKLRSAVISSIQVTNQDLNNYYKEVKARHILIKFPVVTDNMSLKDREAANEVARQKAESVLAKAKSGEDFAKLAMQNSDDSSAKNGGDLGWFGVGVMVKEFEDAAFSLAPGELTGPVKTNFGYHIVKVDDIRYKEKPANKTDDDLKNELLAKKRQDAFDTFLAPLRKSLKVDIFDPELLAYQDKMQGKLQDSINQYQRIVAKNPSSPVPHIFIAQLYEAMGDFVKAKAELQKGTIKEELNSSMKTPYLHLAIAEMYMKSKDNAQAIDALKTTSLMAADNTMIHEKIASYYKELKQGLLEKAEQEEIARIKTKQMQKEASANAATLAPASAPAK